jgi:murein DD-endopeptidase MepM/ murein hydrolase activator NlpD
MVWQSRQMIYRGIGVFLGLCAAFAMSCGAMSAVRAQQTSGEHAPLSLREALFDTAERDQIPKAAIEEFVRLQALALDLDQPSGTDTSFKLLYEPGQLSAGSLAIGGETSSFYRFATSDGAVDYYDETGKSLRRTLARKPLPTGVLRRGFGETRDPITDITRMHTGVDWEAPMGADIVAAGNGVIEIAEWHGGYGNYLLIQHGNGYESAYAHLQRFAPNIIPGARVQQGQVIGYVGATGVSTGPHLHYELLVNQRFVDPLRLKLPRMRVLYGDELTAFARERERLDAALADASPTHNVPGATTQPRNP